MESKNIKLTLEGLNCAVCGKKIEEKILSEPYVNSVKLNLLTNELTFDSSLDDEKLIISNFQKIVNAIEKNVTVKKINEPEIEQESKNYFKIIIFSVGLLCFITSFVIKNENYKFILNIIAYFLIGFDVIIIAVKNIFSGEFFDENFLMLIATSGAFFIGQHSEAVAVMIFYKVGETLQNIAVNNSKKSIKSLLQLKPENANLIKDNEILKVSPDEVFINDTILIKSGETIPLDGVVIDGESFADTSTLTGESLPKKIVVGSEVLAGYINKSSVLKVKVTKNFDDTSVKKIMDLVTKAYESSGNTESFITKFAKIYTPIVVLLAFIVGIVIPLMFNQPMYPFIYKACVFLVISCPCALVISIPLTFFSAIGFSATKGILFKSSNSIENLSKIKTIAFDKTGTLTKGNFEVVYEYFEDDKYKDILISIEKNSNHPISLAILKKYDNKNLECKNIEEISGKGLVGTCDNKKYFIGNLKLMMENNINLNNKIEKSGTNIFIGTENKIVGHIVLSDVIKDECFTVIENLKKIGKKIIMITGDSEKISNEVKETLKIHNAYSNLLPEDKVSIVKKIDNIAFVGDGINDAAALVTADVGISMGTGADVSIDSADVVIENSNLTKIIDVIRISNHTILLAKENIIFSIGIKVIIMILSLFGYANMWLAVFADVGVTIICIVNSLRKSKNLIN